MLVIVGLIVDAAKVRSLTLDFLNLKRQYFPKKFGNGNHQLDDVLVEIKGSDLRSTIRQHGAHADATLKFIDDTLDLLRANEARLFATVWVKGTRTRRARSGRATKRSLRSDWPDFA